MNTTQLEYFRKIAEIGNMTKAAEELHVSQPALSRIIKTMEKELDMVLFERAGRNIILSQSGKEFYNTCEQFLSQVDLIRLASKTNSKTAGSLSIVTCVENMHVARLISEFSLLYPNILLCEKTSYAYDNYVDWDDCDFAIRATSGDTHINFSDGFARTPASSSNNFDDTNSHNTNNSFKHLVKIMDEPYALVVNKDMKIASKDIISLKEAADLPFILPTAEHSHRARILELCKQYGFIPNCRLETTHYSIVLEMISRSECVALIPQNAPGLAGFSQAKMIKLDNPDIKRIINLYQNTEKEETPAAAAFREFVQAKLALKL
ncbi:LysR family transcriptional regulator [Pseudobutyrivibrio sp. MD2005]|uniref:LysR family transcriptional regulator n=1 Tax=Pseudobutyrivibrio sp. MD2005 TaxID=1410616 RepID=UPI0004815682|nr:LysR family transcriptional regulator [Pseudobutyrivibrio sp. MD2005]